MKRTKPMRIARSWGVKFGHIFSSFGLFILCLGWRLCSGCRKHADCLEWKDFFFFLCLIIALKMWH